MFFWNISITPTLSTPRHELDCSIVYIVFLQIMLIFSVIFYFDHNFGLYFFLSLERGLHFSFLEKLVWVLEMLEKNFRLSFVQIHCYRM